MKIPSVKNDYSLFNLLNNLIYCYKILSYSFDDLILFGSRLFNLYSPSSTSIRESTNY
jgi:hypothetical protein